MKKFLLIFVITLLFVTSCTSQTKQSDNTTATDSISTQISDTLQKSIDTVAAKQPINKPDTAKKQTIPQKKQTENGKSIKVMPVKMRENWYRWDRKIIETYLIDSLNEITKNYGTYILINKNNNTAFYYEFPGSLLIYKINNFPTELMKLNIPYIGIPVIFSAKVYYDKEPPVEQLGLPRYSTFDLKLTEIKIYTNNSPKQKDYWEPKFRNDSNHNNK